MVFSPKEYADTFQDFVKNDFCDGNALAVRRESQFLYPNCRIPCREPKEVSLATRMNDVGVEEMVLSLSLNIVYKDPEIGSRVPNEIEL